MAKKIGKKQRKAKRIPEPASNFIGSEGTKTEVLYFKWIADRLEEQYSGFQGRIEVPSFHIKGIGSSNLRLLDDIADQQWMQLRIQFINKNSTTAIKSSLKIHVKRQHFQCPTGFTLKRGHK